MFDLKDKVAIVTGGSRGIGLSITKKLVEFGARVIMNYYSDDAQAIQALDSFSEKKNIYAIKADVSQEDQVEMIVKECVQKFGRVDILINNAGIQGEFADSLQYSLESWERVLKTNLTSSFLCSKHVVPLMIKQNYGRIISVSSIAAQEGYPRCAAYATSKAGMIGLTKSLAKEVAEYNITVNAVLPGITSTRMADDLTNKKIEMFVKKIHKGRMAVPDDVANMVLFLSTNEAEYITAECFKITGGR